MAIYYKLLKLNRLVKNHRVKFIGIAIFHFLRKRHIYLNIDPVYNCNLRCKMCNFSEPGFIPKNKKMTRDDIDRIAKIIFKQTLRLQIGCAAEPTVYKDFIYIIKKGKEYGIPNIALTTNANLLNEEKIKDIVTSGLQEIIISMHGVKKETYEYFMENANFDKFVINLHLLDSEKKKQNSNLPNIRINYPYNEDNYKDLNYFFDIFGNITIKWLQIRPIRKMGESNYNKFDISKISNEMTTILDNLQKEAKLRNITLLRPDLSKLQINNTNNTSEIIRTALYRYISPDIFWESNFNKDTETYYSYCKRKKWIKYLLKMAFTRKSKISTSTDSLNYDII